MAITKLVCLGDSLTEGYGIQHKFRWSDILADTMRIDVHNAGISGDTTNGMLSRIDKDVIAYDPSHVIIMGGANDLSFGLSDQQIMANIHAMSRQLKHYGINYILACPTPCNLPISPRDSSLELNSYEYKDRLLIFQEKCKEKAKRDDVPYIDFAIGIENNDLMEDGIHLNESGNAKMAQIAIAVLRRL